MLAFPPDVTFVIQLVSFFVLLFVLRRILFVPFGELLAERERRTEGAREQAARDQAEAVALERAITLGLNEARAIAVAEAESIRRDARERETAMFNDAKLSAATRLAELRRAIAEERERAKKALNAEATGLAHAMVEAVLRPQDARTAR